MRRDCVEHEFNRLHYLTYCSNCGVVVTLCLAVLSFLLSLLNWLCGTCTAITAMKLQVFSEQWPDYSRVQTSTSMNMFAENTEPASKTEL